MAQKSKITSRPMTKALGTASILSMAIAGANMAHALQTDFGIDYQADAFAVESDVFDEAAGYESTTDNGLAHLLRLKANFKDEETGVSLHTSIELAGDRWAGDARDNASAYSYNAQTGDDVRLDLGYVQLPLAGGIIRVGRQAANWNNCFLVCEDRRDRIIGLFPTGVGTVIGLYDRRQDGVAFRNPDNGDMIAAGLITRLGGMNAGLLWVHWFKNSDGNFADGSAVPGVDYVVQGAHILSPYISGNITDNIDFAVGVNWIGENEIETGADNGQIYADSAFSEYVRLGTDIGALALDFQWVGTQDGGVISPGFDTYSNMLNNNPESRNSPSSMYRMGGGSGLEDFNENLLIARAGFDITPKFNLSGSVGTLMLDDGDDDDSSMVYDVEGTYTFGPNVSTSLSWGMLTENDLLVTSGNNLVPDSGGASLADDDLMAVNARVNVSF